MLLDAAEFIRRFLLHVLPSGLHRVRHCGLFAGTVRARSIERVRQLLAAPKPPSERSPTEADSEAETPQGDAAGICGDGAAGVRRKVELRIARFENPVPSFHAVAERSSGSLFCCVNIETQSSLLAASHGELRVKG